MKKTILLILIVLFVFSCSLNKKSEETNINELIYTLQDILFETYDADQETTQVKTPIDPFLWYRTKSSGDTIKYDIGIDVFGDSAYATIKMIFLGDLNLWYADSDTVHIEKPYIDTFIKYCFFKKDTTLDYHNGWRLVKITNTFVKTKNPSDVNIDSIKIFADGVIDTVIKMDTSYFSKNDIVKIPSGTIVQITLFSPDTTSKFFAHTALKRKEIIHSSGDIFTQNLRVPYIKKSYRLLIDGFTKGSLEDDSCEYSTFGIILPYTVE